MGESLSNVKKETHKIILVHGTWADSEEDEGEKWWQEKSPFQEKLNCYLNNQENIHYEFDTVFHWSGENSASDRREAAKKLYKEIREKYEHKEQPYHIIGHSHGGSIIWDVLSIAYCEFSSWKWRSIQFKLRKDKPLRFLRSWTTIGTPFVILKPSFLSILSIFLGLFVFIQIIEPNLNIFSNDSVLVLGANIVIVYLCAVWINSVFDAFKLAKELGQSTHIIRNHANSWLNLKHFDDEAFNGIKAGLDIKGKIVQRQKRFNDVFLFWVFAVIVFPIRLIVNPIYNQVFAPLGDYFVWKKIKNYFAGNDRGAAKINSVSTEPLEKMKELPYLPEKLAVELKQSADKEAARLISEFRPLLSRLGSGIGKTVFEEIYQNEILSGKELIHTSYLEHGAIQKIIANHILEFSEEKINNNLDEDVITWLKDYRNTMGRLVDEKPEINISIIYFWLVIFLVSLTVLYGDNIVSEVMNAMRR